MTYKELLQQLQQLNEEQLNSDVCIWKRNQIHQNFRIYEIDEFYQDGVEFVFATEECQALHVDHPIIRF